jgi:hypothetical protein
LDSSRVAARVKVITRYRPAAAGADSRFAAVAQHQPHVQRGDGPGFAGAGAGLDQARAVQRESQRRELIGGAHAAPSGSICSIVM